ncbi:hypothetical protein E4695_07070 [Alcaligenaceae bacterium 429]|nr:hypothetical protein E4695_07070 [Alcaligenaceae bacterium 429]
MTQTQISMHNIDSFFFSPSEELKNKNILSTDNKLGFLTIGALLDSRVCQALNEITQLPKPGSAIPAQVPFSMEKHLWNPIRAWREYLCLSSECMAKKMNLDVAEYLEIEDQPAQLDDEAIHNISAKLGIHKRLLMKSIEKYNHAWAFMKGINPQ